MKNTDERLMELNKLRQEHEKWKESKAAMHDLLQAEPDHKKWLLADLKLDVKFYLGPKAIKNKKKADLQEIWKNQCAEADPPSDTTGWDEDLDAELDASDGRTELSLEEEPMFIEAFERLCERVALNLGALGRNGRRNVIKIMMEELKEEDIESF